MNFRFFTIVISVTAILFLLASCGKGEVTDDTTVENTSSADAVVSDTTVSDSSDESIPQENATVTEEETVTDLAAEKGVYDDVTALFTGLFDGKTELYSDGTAGVSELINMRGADEAAAITGYAFYDISGDGNDEFIVGFIDDNGKGSQLLAVFANDNGNIVNVLEGTSRNAYFLLDDNRLFHQGSGGAATSIFAEYTLAADGKTLVCKNYWFTDADAENPYELEYYHNTSGSLNIASSEKLSVTEDEFFSKQDAFTAAKKQISLTPFSK